jgi:hypothetical protein
MICLATPIAPPRCRPRTDAPLVKVRWPRCRTCLKPPRRGGLVAQLSRLVLVSFLRIEKSAFPIFGSICPFRMGVPCFTTPALECPRACVIGPLLLLGRFSRTIHLICPPWQENTTEARPSQITFDSLWLKDQRRHRRQYRGHRSGSEEWAGDINCHYGTPQEEINHRKSNDLPRLLSVEGPLSAGDASVRPSRDD